MGGGADARHMPQDDLAGKICTNVNNKAATCDGLDSRGESHLFIINKPGNKSDNRRLSKQEVALLFQPDSCERRRRRGVPGAFGKSARFCPVCSSLEGNGSIIQCRRREERVCGVLQDPPPPTSLVRSRLGQVMSGSGAARLSSWNRPVIHWELISRRSG